MLEVHIDKSELDRLVGKLEQTPQVLAQARRQAHEAAASKLKEAVQREVGGSGRVRSWQEGYVGSGGGYAAARPLAETYAESRGKQIFSSPHDKPHPTYAVGYITNAINSGHKARAGKLGFRSNPVHGKEFYQRAQGQAEQVAQEAANQIVHALTSHLGG